MKWVSTLCVLFVAVVASAQDLTTVSRIRNEGFRNSKVMDYAEALTDRIGGRLTGSPNM